MIDLVNSKLEFNSDLRIANDCVIYTLITIEEGTSYSYIEKKTFDLG